MRRIKRRFDRKAELGKAAERLAKGDLAGARAGCAKLLERDPDDADALELRAAVALEQGRFDEALADLDRALAVSANAARHRGRAGALIALRRLDEAEDALEEALALEPGDPTIYELWTALRRARGDLEGALDAAEGALTLDPRRLEAMRLRAELLVELGREEEAVAAYRDAVRSSARGSRARRAAMLEALGDLLEKRGEAEEAADARKLAAALRS